MGCSNGKALLYFLYSSILALLFTNTITVANFMIILSCNADDID